MCIRDRVFPDRDDFMIPLVEGGADEVVHARIHDFKGFGLSSLFIQAEMCIRDSL